MRTLRASEIGDYYYCQRAWWYRKSGAPSQNQAELAAGRDIHDRHGQAVMRAGCLQTAAFGLLVAAAALLALHLLGQLL
jgi:CRISPR/Cas system-associated exonuclease Cas4 (RecB family)